MLQQILIIGSDLNSCKKLKYSLQNDLTRAYYTLSIDDGIRHLIHYGYHLIIFNLTCTNTDVMRSLSLLRKARFTPILVLSPETDADRIVQILEIADDFLQTPNDLKVCKARIKALLRRYIITNGQEPPGVLSRDGSLMIDTRCRKVYILETEIKLPRKQYDLLYLMASREGQVFTHDQLYRNIWGDDFINCSNAPLNCQIRKLRRQLESVPGTPKYIHTMRGVGYRFDSNTQ